MEVISPAPLRSHEPDYLPAYLANGLVGRRVREIRGRAAVRAWRRMALIAEHGAENASLSRVD